MLLTPWGRFSSRHILSTRENRFIYNLEIRWDFFLSISTRVFRALGRARIYLRYFTERSVLWLPLRVTVRSEARATPSSKNSLVIDYVNIFTHLLTYLCDAEAVFERFVTVLMVKYSNEFVEVGGVRGLCHKNKLFLQNKNFLIKTNLFKILKFQIIFKFCDITSQFPQTINVYPQSSF